MYLWNLDNRQLIQVIELPDKVKSVKDIQFVTNVMALNQHQVGWYFYFTLLERRNAIIFIIENKR